jgi:hypothetical protein
MKTDEPNKNDVPLRSLLKEWQPEASLPPRFQERVWRRIEHAETAPVPSVSLAAVFANWIANLLPKPALAMAYVTVLLLVGASLGWGLARQEAFRISGELSARYAQAVDPYRATPQP